MILLLMRKSSRMARSFQLGVPQVAANYAVPRNTLQSIPRGAIDTVLNYAHK